MSLDEVKAFLNTPTSTRTPLPDRADILARIDLEALFLEHGYTQGRNRQWTCPDPQHAQTGATPPVSISEKDGRQVWYCHGCGTGGSAIDVLIAEGTTERDAMSTLATKAGYGNGPATAPPAPIRQAAQAPTTPPKPLEPDAGLIPGPEGQTILDTYLEQRGWTREAADAFGLTPVHNPTQGTAIRHPYRANDETIWYQDRSTGNRGPKWSNPPGHPRTLHAIDLADAFHIAVNSDPPHMYIVEGPADVIAMWHLNPGFPVIGIPGTGSATPWGPMLSGLQTLILTDPDDTGDKAATDLASAIEDANGWATRLRPPMDIADWYRSAGADAVRAGIIALADTEQQRIDATT